ncbi:MAG: carbonate dehydratase [Mariprofundales bacterium]
MNAIITTAELLANNKRWAANKCQDVPTFFSDLAKQQTPRFLWIGCADSRVPANEIVGMQPGSVFVHRNIANIVVHSDLNCLSVIQYAVDVLNIEQIIVCGHYGCGGVQAALENKSYGLIDNWLRHIRDIYIQHKQQISALEPEQQADRLCEYNVLQQVRHVCQTSIVQQAWADGKKLSVHAWIYRLADGIINDLGVCNHNDDKIINK